MQPRDYEAQVWKAEKAQKPRNLRHSRAESPFCKGFHDVARIRVLLRSFRAKRNVPRSTDQKAVHLLGDY
jgi:hypothetical protein